MRFLLAISSLAILWAMCGKTCAQPKQAPAKVALTREVVGVGATMETAKKNAVHEAAKTADGLCKLHNSMLQPFEVTDDYVRRTLLVGSGRAGEDVTLEIDQHEHVFKQWVVTLRPDLERFLRAEERQKITYFVMFGLSLLLLAGYGYVRLDDYTKRRYTTWLRVASVGVMSLVLAGWWMVFQGGW